MSQAPPLPSASANGHRPQLDGLRALAVGAVLLCHTLPGLPLRWEFGAIGVRLFFVLSGFLITGILLRARAEATAKNAGSAQILVSFYARRFLRIFPLYYFVLILATLLDLPQVRETLGWHLTYLSNFYIFAHHTRETPAYLCHLWSLAVEEQFYLVWPMLVLFLPLRRLPLVLLVAIALAPLSRYVFGSLSAGFAPQHAASVVTTSCLDALAAGALLATVWEAGPAAVVLRRRLRRLSLTMGMVLLVGVVAMTLLRLDWRYAVACKHLGYALVACWLVDRAAEGFGGVGRWILQTRPIVYIGGISYGIYVYHEFVPTLLGVCETRLGLSLHFPPEGGPLCLLYVTAVTLLIASLSWHLFEKPLNNLKDRFPYVRKATPSFGTGWVWLRRWKTGSAARATVRAQAEETNPCEQRCS